MKKSHAVRRGLAVTTAVSALAAPAVSAAPIEQLRPSSVNDEPGKQASVRVVEVSADDSFDWGDAGIGATGLLALAAIATGATVLARHRSDPGHTAA